MPNDQKNPLPGHVRVKQKMVPEFLTKMPMTFSRYADDVLPELMLIAMLNDAHGYKKGAELSFFLANELKRLGRIGSPFISAFLGLETNQTDRLKIALKNAGKLECIALALTPINQLLGPTPISFLGLDSSLSKEQCLEHLRTCVDRHLNRYSHPSTCALATLYYTQARLGRIKIADGLHVPDLESLHTDPDSEEAERTAADVRIYSLMEIGMHQKEHPSNWPIQFWGRCRTTSPCEPWNGKEEPIG